MLGMDTVTRLRNDLRARIGEWPTIGRRTGLSYWWLTKFGQGLIKNPGYGKVETLQAYFDKYPAENDAAAATPPQPQAA